MVARAQLLRAMVLQGATMVVRTCWLGERLRVAQLLRARVLQGSTMVVRACRLGEQLRVRVATTMVARTKWLSAMVLE
jgi:hypothetical protein